MKLILTLEGSTQQILDVLGLLLTEDMQGYITNMKTEGEQK